MRNAFDAEDIGISIVQIVVPLEALELAALEDEGAEEEQEGVDKWLDGGVDEEGDSLPPLRSERASRESDDGLPANPFLGMDPAAVAAAMELLAADPTAVASAAVAAPGPRRRRTTDGKPLDMKDGGDMRVARSTGSSTLPRGSSTSAALYRGVMLPFLKDKNCFFRWDRSPEHCCRGEED